MSSGGYVDLHLHCLPGVDDGVRTFDQSVALCRGLSDLGFSQLVTTPHIRSGMFDNTRAGLTQAFAQFEARLVGVSGLPEIGLSAEHHCDGRLLELIEEGGLLAYPGASAILIEFAYDSFPVGVERLTFKLAVKRLRPVIAHPERYAPMFRRTDPIQPLIDQDVGLQLDLMSLTGKYGRAPRRAAERMLEEGVYTIAASDAHHPDDLGLVGKGLETLFKRVDDDEAEVLLQHNPRALLNGSALQ